MAGRRLVVMRHARTVSHAPSDRERALTPGGRRDAEAAGRFLGRADVRPDHAVVSDALRTRQTWDAVSAGFAFEGEPVLSDEVYRGSADSLLELVRALPPDVSSVLLIGHNPAVSQLVSTLDDGGGEPDAVAAVTGGFPPGGVAVLQVDVPWADTGPGTGRLDDVFIPGERE